MKLILKIILILTLCGCGEQLLDFSKETKVETKHQTDGSASLNGSIDIKYPQPTSVNVTASGNSNPVINITAPSDNVEATQSKKETASLRHEDSFSFDEMIDSVPAWMWPCIFFSLAILLVVYIVWSKTTAAGKAFDNLSAGALGALGDVQTILRKRLEGMNTGTDKYNALKQLYDEVRDIETSKAHQARRKF